MYFIVNVLWVVATFFLQAIGGDVLSIEIPKYDPINKTLLPDPMKVEPLSLMFLLSFAVLLIVQFLAMLYHRYNTRHVPPHWHLNDQFNIIYMELDYLRCEALLSSITEYTPSSMWCRTEARRKTTKKRMRRVNPLLYCCLADCIFIWIQTKYITLLIMVLFFTGG